MTMDVSNHGKNTNCISSRPVTRSVSEGGYVRIVDSMTLRFEDFASRLNGGLVSGCFFLSREHCPRLPESTIIRCCVHCDHCWTCDGTVHGN